MCFQMEQTESLSNPTDPQSQKDEIEVLIWDMLHAALIRESNSPFLSPVLLFKKKGGSYSRWYPINI